MRTTVDRLRWLAVTYEPYWLILCLLIGAGLRLFRLEAQSLWSDEGLQYYVASAPSLEIFWERVESRTFHPALSFLISRASIQIHDSDFFLRLPSVLFGVASMLLVYGLVRKLTSVSVALAAVWVFAISPFHIWYSQEARMYAPLLFIALLSTLVFLRAAEARRWYWWVLYAGTLAAGLYLHVFIVLQILVHGLWLLVAYRHAWLAFCGTGVVTAALAFPVVSPWGAYVLRRVSPGLVEGVAVASGKRMVVGWEGVFYALYAYGAGFSLGPSLEELHISRSGAALLPYWPIIAAVGLVYGGLLCVGLFSLPKRHSWRLTWQCLIAFAAPILGAVLMTAVSSFSFNVRYTIIVFPYFCLLLGVAVVCLGRQRIWLGAVALLAVVCLSAFSLANHFGEPRYGKTDLRGAVAQWRAADAPGVLLSVSPSGGVRDTVNRYLSPAERGHHTPLGGGATVDQVKNFFDTHEAPHVYVLFARDWHKRRETSVRDAFTVLSEQTFVGAVLLKIARR